MVDNIDLNEPENLLSDAVCTWLSEKRIKIIISGHVDENDIVDIEKGIRPRSDIFEFERRFGAKFYDFNWLKRRLSEKNKVTSWINSKISNLSILSAIEVYKVAKDDDLIYATNEDVGLPLAALLRLGRRKRPFLLLRIENFSYGRNALYRFIHKWFMQFSVRRIDLFFCRSPKHIAILEEKYGVPRHKVILAPEPVDIAYFDKENRPDTVVDVAIPDAPFILSAGLEMRDYETLLAAVAGLPIQIIIGAGSPWSHFRFTPDEQQNTNNVTVDSFTRLQMRELYRAARLVVVPVKPTIRTCGISVILEALAMERPVIASRTQGLEGYYMEDGETGCLVPPGNSEMLRKEIVRLLSNSAEIEQLAHAGHEKVVSQFYLDKYVDTVGTAAARLLGIV